MAPRFSLTPPASAAKNGGKGEPEVFLPQPLAVITGAGIVAPSGVTSIEPLALPDGRPVPPFGCPVQGFEVKKHLPSIISYVDRCSALALVAVKLALESAKVDPKSSAAPSAAPSTLNPPPSTPPQWGLAYSSAWGCLDSMELFFAKVAAGQAKFAPPLVFSHSYVNTPSSLACIEFGLAGPGATFSQGAAGAIVALGWARDRLLRTSGAECAGFVAAASDSLSKALRRHYAAAGELSVDGSLAPFDPAGAGTVLGEAGAALTVELEDVAIARGARPLAAIRGWGSAVGTDPRRALAQAINAALTDSAVSPNAEGSPAVASAKAGRKPIAAVYCDASGRPDLDRAEAAALDETVGPASAVPRRTVKSRAGECGPAASLISAAGICSAAPGIYLVTALDRSGASALILERTP